MSRQRFEHVIRQDVHNNPIVREVDRTQIRSSQMLYMGEEVGRRRQMP